MKNRMFVLSALLSGMSFGAEFAPVDLAAKDLSPLAVCRAAKGAPVVWIEDGKALLPIVADAKDREADAAAKFLQDLVFRMTGVKPPVVARAEGPAVRIATAIPKSGAFTVKTEGGSAPGARTTAGRATRS